MTSLRVATAQFEPADSDREANLNRIRKLTRRAVGQGAEVVSFHECSLSGYSFVQMYSREQMLDLAEPVPDGPAVQGLIDIAREFGVTLLAGLFEREAGQIFNTYVCVDASGMLARHRKLRPQASRDTANAVGVEPAEQRHTADHLLQAKPEIELRAYRSGCAAGRHAGLKLAIDLAADGRGPHLPLVLGRLEAQRRALQVLGPHGLGIAGILQRKRLQRPFSRSLARFQRLAQ